MINKNIKIQSNINAYADDIFEQYSNFVGELNVGEYEEKFVKNLVTNCVNTISESDIFDILKMLRKKGLMSESILKRSSINKANKVSNKSILNSLKCEIEECTYNIGIKHIDDDLGETLLSFETDCFTIPSLEDKIIIGENFANIIYKNKRKKLVQDVIKNSEPKINFSINNLLVLHKKEYSNNDYKEYINIIVVPKLDYSTLN